MKILLTMNLPYTRAYGGANRSNRALAEVLANRHHSVCVVVPALAPVSSITHQQFRDELIADGIRVKSNRESDVFKLNGVEVHAVLEPSRLCGYLAGQIRKLQPDWTLVSSEDRSQALLESALKAHPAGVIYLAHTPQMFPFGLAGLYPGKRRTELIGHASAVITISRFVADYIRQWTGFESSTHHPPHYGSGPFPNCGSIDNDYVLLMNACAVKGISIFLALARAMPNVKFAALPGWGTTAADRSALAELRNVSLLSNCKNLDDVFRRTRAVLMPSLWVEGFGMAAVDAMLRGIPVLASHHGGLIEAKLGTDYLLPVKPIESFEDRLDDNQLPVPVVPAQDIGPWQNALSSLLSDRSLYEKQSTEARGAALRFVAELDIKPLEDLLLRLATEVKTQGRHSVDMQNHQSKHRKADAGGIDESLADLSPEQQALLMLRLRKNALKRAKPEPSTPPTKPVLRDQKFPLSFAQQRLWFLDQLEPASPLYNVPCSFRLSGQLDVDALTQSFNELVQRHESLRTTFVAAEGEPMQVIAPRLTIKLPVIDLRSRALEERRAEAVRLATEEALRPFDLSRGPMIRVTLLRLDQEEHVLLLTMHHIVSDGWSMAVLFRELSAFYAALCSGEACTLVELPLQYADFAAWQREWLQGEVLEEQLSYWKKQLAGAPARLELPTDRPRPAVQGFHGARQARILPQALTNGLKALSREEGVTLFMTLMAAFQALLQRYSGQDDIVVGTPIAGRNRTEIEGLIGFFVNTLVFRTDLTGNPTFRELLARVRQVALEAYGHQDVPFEKLVEELHPQRNFSHSPLFQVFFAFQNASTPELTLAGLSVTPLKTESDMAKFDLTLAVSDRANSLHASLGYNTDLFDETMIARMIGSFGTLLEGIVSNPDQRLSDLAVLTETETEQLLVNWNHTRRAYPRHGCIHQLFQEQVERSPDAVAVSFEDKEVTYGELNRWANQLAHHLQKLGAGPEMLVGICMERSLEMIIALLGILKAGAAYLPLDPSYPKERLTFMLKDTQSKVLLTQQHAIENLPENDAHLICLEKEWGLIARESEQNPIGHATAENLAYVMYTSGSTGEPKGVGVTHRGVVRLVKQTDYAELSDKEVFLQFAPLAFDASTFEIWGCLLNGGKLVVFPPALPSLEDLGETIARAGVSTLWLTSALFTEMVEHHLDMLAGLKQLLAGGDVLSASRAKRFLKRLSECRLINGYGPTENTTFTCCYPMISAEQVGDSVSIGRPIANTEVYLLDRHLNPVPIGVFGELYTGGDGLARGYFNNPELTAEKFIAHPFGSEPGARLYKTGDLARYLSDGRIEFLGRIDNQVKIRGFRIELGEIESVLLQHPGVKETVVLAQEEVERGEFETQGPQLSEKRLVAYLLANPRANITAPEVRLFLKEKLPDYMVPSTFVFVDAMPLTPNGKLDRKALPEPNRSNSGLPGDFAAPRTLVEEIIAGIWAEVLNLETFGIHDNFFDLGGHSLKATQVVSRLRGTFRMDLPLRVLFEAPTVAEFALRVEQSLADTGGLDELARYVAEVDSLTDEEVERQLKKKAQH